MDGLIHPSLFFYFFIGQIDACEFFFCSFPYVFAEVTDFIRMVFPCHLAVGFFYLVIAGIGGDAQSCVCSICIRVIHGFEGIECGVV